MLYYECECCWTWHLIDSYQTTIKKVQFDSRQPAKRASKSINSQIYLQHTVAPSADATNYYKHP